MADTITMQPALKKRKSDSTMAAIPGIDFEKCTGCGDCVELCPTNVVELVQDKAMIVRPEDCNYCTDCEVFCSSGAIRCPFEIIVAKPYPESFPVSD